MRTLYLSTSENLQRAWFIGEDCKPTRDFGLAKKFKNLEHFFGWVEQHRILLAEGMTYATDLDTTIGRTDFILCYNNNIAPERGMSSGIVQHHESKRPVGLITTLRRIGLVQSLLEKKCLQHFDGRLIFVRERVLFDSFVTSNGEYTNDLGEALVFRDRDALDKYIKHWHDEDDTLRDWCFRKETRESKRLFSREEPTKFWYPIHQFQLCRIHVTKYNTIEFVRVYSEGINNYADVLNQIFYKYSYDDKPDAVATALKVYSGTGDSWFRKTLEKHVLNSLYGIEGLHITTDGIKVANNLGVPRWEVAKSNFELDYNNHPEYSKSPAFLTKCFNIPYDLNMSFDERLKAEVFFDQPRHRIDYTKMYKHYDIFSDIDPNAGVIIYDGDTDIKMSEGYRKELLKKLAEQYLIPYSVLEAMDDIPRRDDDSCLVWDCKESKLKLGKNPAKELEKGENDMRLRVPEIKKVIFNKPAVIVLWKDGTKTVVKVQGKSRYDKEKGLAMAIAKKALGNEGNYYNEFRKWLEE